MRKIIHKNEMLYWDSRVSFLRSMDEIHGAISDDARFTARSQYCPPRLGWRALSPQEESATRLYDRCMAAQEGVCWAAARQAYRDATGGG